MKQNNRENIKQAIEIIEGISFVVSDPKGQALDYAVKLLNDALADEEPPQESTGGVPRNADLS